MTPEETIERLEQCEYCNSVLPDALSLTGDSQKRLFHMAQRNILQKLFPIYSTKRILPQKEHFRDIISRAGLQVNSCSKVKI